MKPEGGTGFLVAVPLKNDPKQSAKFIITARHVVDPEWAGCPWSNPSVLYARVNIKGYKSDEMASGVWQTSFNLTKEKTWFAPDDDKVDIAVIPFQSQKQLDEFAENDVTSLDFSDVATEAELQKFDVGTGDGVGSAGLVPALFDAKRNYPGI